MVSERQRLIRTFLSEEPYLVSFQYRRKDFKSVKLLLEELIQEGLIKQVEKTSKTVLYKYIGEEAVHKPGPKIKKLKAVQSKKELVPLHTISNGGHFRIPGMRKKLRKRDNLNSIPVQKINPDGSTSTDAKPGCTCVDSSGRTSVKDWYLMVEVVE